MEYVGGKSLKQIRAEARQQGGAVPLAHALAYAIEILPALGYLHDRGLVYCDFKPDNVIQTEEQLKLIDMGGVRQIDSDDRDLRNGGVSGAGDRDRRPLAEFDLYTVGRALAVLTFDFPGYQGEYTAPAAQNTCRCWPNRSRSPGCCAAPPAPTPTFGSSRPARWPSRSPGCSGRCWPAPTAIRARRSLTCSAPNCGGGRHRLHARPPAGGPPPGQPAARRGGDRRAARAARGRQRPGRRVPGHARRPADGEPGRGPGRAIAGDAGAPPAVAASRETRLALVRALVTAGDRESAAARLAELAAADPGDWRIAWYTGLCALADGQQDRAQAAFGVVYDELPGELAPKLALGFAAEASGDLATARRYYQLVEMIDRSYISAAFGAARACLPLGDRPAAIAAVAAVPETSSHHAGRADRRGPAAGHRRGQGVGRRRPRGRRPPGAAVPR